jgi:hypothetical protein
MPSDNLYLGDGIKATLVGPVGEVKQRMHTNGSIREVASRSLSLEDRATRPRIRQVRTEYQHQSCRTTTRIGLGIAETFSIDPTFYSTTYCQHCLCYFPTSEFIWIADESLVGS